MKIFFVIVVFVILYALAFCKTSWKNDKPYKDPYENKEKGEDD